MKRLVAVVGPTASGKSQLALELSKNFSGEIINADSRQIYRHMDIGTAKPNRDELSLIRHHLIDLINPDESFGLALYQRLAFKSIRDILTRKNLPFIVGGSGLYVWSVLEGWKIPLVPPNSELRRALEEKAEKNGGHALFQELQRIDPLAATKILPGNVRRIIRALEIFQKTGRPASELWKKQKPPYDILILGLTAKRHELYSRIDSRVDEMINNGLIDEVKALLASGYGLDLPSMSGIGYKQIAMFLEGRIELKVAIEHIKTETHRLARHQYAWFRLSDPRIHWLNESGDLFKEGADLINSFLAGSTKQVAQS